MELLKEHYQELKIQLQTKVNDHKREMEETKRAFAEERRELEQAFQLEVGVLQGQKAELATLHAESQEVVRGLQEQLQRRAELERGHTWWLSQERARLQEALQRLRSATPALRDLRSKNRVGKAF